MNNNAEEEDEGLQLFHDLHNDHHASLLLDDCELPPGPGEDKLSTSPILQFSTPSSGQKGMLDDFLKDSGKNDYDWLLTPPGTPLSLSVDNEPTKTSTEKKSTCTRVLPALKTSRLSKPQTDSTSRNIANGFRSQPGTPSKSGHGFTSTTNTQENKARKSSTPKSASSSRSSTPVSRANLSSRRPLSKPQTPSSATHLPRRPSTASSASRPLTPPSTSVTSQKKPSSRPRSSSTGKTTAIPSRRGTSPVATSRSVQASLIPGMTTDAPANLRTTASDRTSSVKKGRPLVPSSHPQKSLGSDSKTTITPRRQPSPSLTRGRTVIDSSRLQSIKLHGGGVNDQAPVASRVGEKASALGGTKVHDRGSAPGTNKMFVKTSAQSGVKVADNIPRARAVSSTLQSKKTGKPGFHEIAGFGMTMSKSSLEMAIRHMDIRKNTTSLNTTSIRSSASNQSYTSNTSSSSLLSLWSATTRGKCSNISDSTGPSGSNTSSEYGASVAPDPEGSEFGDEDCGSDKGSKSNLTDKNDSCRFSGDMGNSNWLLEQTGDLDEQYLFANNGFDFLSDPVEKHDEVFIAEDNLGSDV